MPSDTAFMDAFSYTSKVATLMRLELPSGLVEEHVSGWKGVNCTEI